MPSLAVVAEVFPPLTAAVAVGAVGVLAIEGGSRLIWPEPSPDPLPLPVNLAQRGKGNVSYDEILNMAYTENSNTKSSKDELCSKLRELMDRFRKCGNNEMYDKAKSTWKDKCRGWRG
jgi:hypothetical protein